tara:strand:+ start:4786 stop:5790 length:1005 start_codon:yes stop_codon:yes gene_type:complete
MQNIINYFTGIALDDVYDFLVFSSLSFILIFPIIAIMISWFIYSSYGIIILVIFLIMYLNIFMADKNIRKYKIWRRLQSLDFWDAIRQATSGKIIIEGEKPLKKNKSHIFAFHPHGYFPLTIGWILNSKELQHYTHNSNDNNKGYLTRFITLVSSMCFNVPLMRELVISFGCTEITKDIFKELLVKGYNLFLCPGGINELLKTEAEKAKERNANNLYISTKHKGFIKQALINNKPIIPVLSFGEQELLSSKTIFRWGKFIIPIPIGRYYLPIPRKQPVTVIIGKPVYYKKCSTPTDDDVSNYHKKFYDKMRDMFYKYKDHPDVAIRYSDIVFTD